MDRVFESGASASPPAAPASPSNGYASAGNPGSATPATKPGPYWYHMMTEEVRGVLVAAGLTPDHTDLTQLAAAVQALANAAAMPVGTIFMVPATSAPAGSVKVNGAELSRTTYAALWAYAQASGNMEVDDATWVANRTANGTNGKFSPGNGTTTFRIPDARGDFPRFLSDGSTVDSGRVIGSYQADAMQGHWHTNPTSFAAASSTTGGDGGLMQSQNNGPINTTRGPVSDGTNGTPRTAAETRSRNTAWLACIKY